MDLIVRKEAELEIARAFAWYERRRPGLGQRFADEVEYRFEQIARDPHLFPAVYKSVRKATLRIFPYGVYYLARNSGIVVLRVLHHRQRYPTW